MIYYLNRFQSIMKSQNQYPCACAIRCLRCLMHVQLLFDHSAMNDGAQEPLSVYGFTGLDKQNVSA